MQHFNQRQQFPKVVNTAELAVHLQVLQSEERMGEGMGLSVGLRGFHPVNPGVDFRQAHRWGLTGPYLAFTKVAFPIKKGFLKPPSRLVYG